MLHDALGEGLYIPEDILLDFESESPTDIMDETGEVEDWSEDELRAFARGTHLAPPLSPTRHQNQAPALETFPRAPTPYYNDEGCKDSPPVFSPDLTGYGREIPESQQSSRSPIWSPYSPSNLPRSPTPPRNPNTPYGSVVMSAVDARRNNPANAARLALMRDFSTNFTILEKLTGVERVHTMRSDYMVQYPSGRYYGVSDATGYVMVGKPAIFYI